MKWNIALVADIVRTICSIEAAAGGSDGVGGVLLLQFSFSSLVAFPFTNSNSVSIIYNFCDEAASDVSCAHCIAILLYFVLVCACIDLRISTVPTQQLHLPFNSAHYAQRCVCTSDTTINHRRNNKFNTESDILCALMGRIMHLFSSSSSSSALASLHLLWMKTFFT